MNLKFLPQTQPAFGSLLVIIAGFLLLGRQSLIGQDTHYSQIYSAPFQINPALTGVFGGDMRFMGNYRNQWSNVPVGYNTFTAGADVKLLGSKPRTGFFALGASYNFDYAGFSKLSTTGLNLNGSYIKKLSKRLYGSVGLQLGATQRAFKTGDLTFDSQYDPNQGVYVPTRANGENFSNLTRTFFDFSGGINIRYQVLEEEDLVDLLEKRTKIDFGVGLFHLNRPNESFLSGTNQLLSRRITPYVLAVLQVSKNLDIVGHTALQFQGTYKEFLSGVAARVHLNRTPGKQLAIQAGVNMRYHQLGDAFYPAFEVHYNTWRVGLSYDINLSKFNNATQNNGGPEIFIQYSIKRVKKLPFYKICPLI
jgi:type IX secretion system PorP/SprF family membrane protein